jgi:hypothetical protein
MHANKFAGGRMGRGGDRRLAQRCTANDAAPEVVAGIEKL